MSLSNNPLSEIKNLGGGYYLQLLSESVNHFTLVSKKILRLYYLNTLIEELTIEQDDLGMYNLNNKKILHIISEKIKNIRKI